MKKGSKRQVDVFDQDEVNDVLRDTFYSSTSSKKSKRKSKPKKATPDHYDVICISMYKEDLSRLDKMVKQLKSTGHRKMSRSALIRFALDQVDPSEIPRSY